MNFGLCTKLMIISVYLFCVRLVETHNVIKMCIPKICGCWKLNEPVYSYCVLFIYGLCTICVWYKMGQRISEGRSFKSIMVYVTIDFHPLIIGKLWDSTWNFVMITSWRFIGAQTVAGAGWCAYWLCYALKSVISTPLQLFSCLRLCCRSANYYFRT